MNLFRKSLLASAALAVSLGASAAVVIDDFTDPVVGGQLAQDTSYTGVDSVGSSSSLNSGLVIGGQRDLFVIEVPVANTNDTSAGIKATVEDGVYNFSSESNKAGVGIIRWDGANTSFAQNAADDVATNVLNAIGSVSAVGFGPENLSATALGFAITVLQADAGFPFTLQAFSGTNSSTVAAIALETTLGSPNTFFVPFSAFAFGTQVGTGADFTAITALQAVINWPGAAVANVDLTIDLVERVPEPGALALVGLALAGLGLSRRFGRKSV